MLTNWTKKVLSIILSTINLIFICSGSIEQVRESGAVPPRACPGPQTAPREVAQGKIKIENPNTSIFFLSGPSPLKKWFCILCTRLKNVS